MMHFKRFSFYPSSIFYRSFLFVLFFGMVLKTAQSQQNCVLTISKDTVLVGEPFELTVSLKLNGSGNTDTLSFENILKAPNRLYIKDSVDLEPFADLVLLSSDWKNLTLTEGFPLKNVPSKPENGFSHYETTLKVAIYNPGIFTLFYPLLNGSPCQENTSVTIEVIVPPLDSIQQMAGDTLYPIKPIFAEPADWTDFMFPVYILLGLILIYLIYRYLKSNKKVQNVEEPANIRLQTPEEIAFEKLQTLKSSDLWNQDDGKEFLARLSFIFREYLENQYNFPAVEMSSPEIMDKIKLIFAENTNLISQIYHLLYVSDMVKFAKAKTNEFKPDDLINQAIQCITDTKNEKK
ncbi:MAG: hypothetical protein IPN79_06670 [Saprospiraceae bacterium]|nr:hypothetical protein [Saprospiraceae bacterium]